MSGDDHGVAWVGGTTPARDVHVESARLSGLGDLAIFRGAAWSSGALAGAAVVSARAAPGAAG